MNPSNAAANPPAFNNVATAALEAGQTVPDLLIAACQRYGKRPAFSNLGKTLSYAQIDALSSDLAASLQHGLKLAPGERVAIMLPNLLQYPVALLAVLRAGCIAVLRTAAPAEGFRRGGLDCAGELWRGGPAKPARHRRAPCDYHPRGRYAAVAEIGLDQRHPEIPEKSGAAVSAARRPALAGADATRPQPAPRALPCAAAANRATAIHRRHHRRGQRRRAKPRGGNGQCKRLRTMAGHPAGPGQRHQPCSTGRRAFMANW